MCSSNVSDCFSISFTKVVLPWSTWAIIAMFRISSRRFKSVSPFPGYLHKKTATSLSQSDYLIIFSISLCVSLVDTNTSFDDSISTGVPSTFVTERSRVSAKIFPAAKSQGIK